jgi:hypothetical protein
MSKRDVFTASLATRKIGYYPGPKGQEVPKDAYGAVVRCELTPPHSTVTDLARFLG